MKLKEIKIVRIVFLAIILIMIGCESLMDTLCVLKNQAHLILYILDIFLYLLIIWVETLQIDYIVQVIKRQKFPHIRGNLKFYEGEVLFSLLLLLIHIIFQSYYMYINGTTKECYYLSQEGNSKFLIFIFTLIVELLVLLDLLIVFIQVFRIIRKDKIERSNFFMLHKYFEDYLVKERDSNYENSNSSFESLGNF